MLADRDAQLALLMEARDRAAAELRRAQAQAEMAATAVTRAGEAARGTAEAETRTIEARARLAAPEATRARNIRDQAWRQLPRAVVDAAEEEAITAFAAVVAATQQAPVERDRNGRLPLSGHPGRAMVGGGSHVRSARLACGLEDDRQPRRSFGARPPD